MKYDGFFADFELDYYHARNKAIGLCFWTANGFIFFRDDCPIGESCDFKPFLRGLNLWQRWRLWREYKRELLRRAERIVLDQCTTPQS